MSDEWDDLDRNWREARLLLESQGEDVEDLLARGGENLDAWYDFLKDATNALAYDDLLDLDDLDDE